MFVDSHCHLNYPELINRMPELLEEMRAQQITHALCASVKVSEFQDILALANQYQSIFASVGNHPDEENLPEEASVEQLCLLAKHKKVVAIGETGLDYFRLGDRSIADMEWQRDRFRQHIRAAVAIGKPLIIHTRSASDDTIAIMREEGAERVGGVMHCFTETKEVAEAALALGFYISISGIVTFKTAHTVQEVAKWVPQNRLLVETDSPFLAPVPMRGKCNQPAYVRYVGAFIAQLRGIDEAQLGKITTENFFRLFRHAAQHTTAD